MQNIRGITLAQGELVVHRKGSTGLRRAGCSCIRAGTKACNQKDVSSARNHNKAKRHNIAQALLAKLGRPTSGGMRVRKMPEQGQHCRDCARAVVLCASSALLGIMGLGCTMRFTQNRFVT